MPRSSASKTRVPGHCLHDFTLSHVSRKPTCDRQTDRHMTTAYTTLAWHRTAKMGYFLYLCENWNERCLKFRDYFRVDTGTAGSSVQSPLDIGSTMVSCYLHMLTSTTMSCLAVSALLKHTVLQHIRSAHFMEQRCLLCC